MLEGEFEVSNSDGDEQATVGPAESVSVSATGSVGAVAPGPTEPPAELDIAAPSTNPDHGLSDSFDDSGGSEGGEDADSGGSDDSGDDCFAAGTLVLMADGEFKPIERVMVGDSVMAYDFPSDRKYAAPVHPPLPEDRRFLSSSQ